MRISDELAASLREDGITQEAINTALEIGRKSGDVILDEENGCLITHAKIEEITLWVKFREVGDDVEVLDAYYHRMNFS
ncbi:MAG: hypothetical protein ACOYIK_10640 [Coriobacteriales bacterium]|jgi:hypothetical protein